MIDYSRLGRMVLHAERQGSAAARARLLERLAGLLAHPEVSRSCLLASLDAALAPARPGEDPGALGRRLFAHLAGAPGEFGGVRAFDPFAAAAEAARREAEAAAARAAAAALELPLPRGLQATLAGRRIAAALALYGRGLRSGLPEVAFLHALGALGTLLAAPDGPQQEGAAARAGALLGDARRARGEWLRLQAWGQGLLQGSSLDLLERTGAAPAVPLLRQVLGALMVDPAYLMLDSEPDLAEWWARTTVSS